LPVRDESIVRAEEKPMSPSALALTGYVAWSLLLTVGIITYRTGLFLTKQHAANGFAPDGSDCGPFSERLCRAHANCYENLPMFASLILLALFTGNGAITDPLARWALVARVAQSVTHLISVSELAVTIRVTLFSVQLAIMAYWVFQLGMLGFQ
jgi:uncharacterized MAPEG superfamily protein